MSEEKQKASERFAKRISTIPGLKHFILARNDGQLVSHNLTDPDNLAAMTTLCGMYSGQIQESLGFSKFRHMVLYRENQEHLLLFPLDRYFLGVVHQIGIDQEKMLDNISQFLTSLLSKRKDN